MTGSTQRSTAAVLTAGWCSVLPAPRRVTASLRSEWPGYLAMVAFLVAYLLGVAGVDGLPQPLLNLTGAAAAVWYMRAKGALPSVISNLAWLIITVAGMIIR